MNTEEQIASEIAAQIDHAMTARKTKQWSQSELSRVSGVPQPTISRTLKGKTTPDTETLTKIARALNIKFKYGLSSLYIDGIKEPLVSSELSPQELHLIDVFRSLPNNHERDIAIKTMLLRTHEHPDSKIKKVAKKKANVETSTFAPKPIKIKTNAAN